MCALALWCGAAPARANPETHFNEAVASYRGARYSDAFGKMLALATRGDADAARIVLFMHQYGPTLYGSYWDLNSEELATFGELAVLAKARMPPAFQPSWNVRRGASTKARRVVPTVSR